MTSASPRVTAALLGLSVLASRAAYAQSAADLAVRSELLEQAQHARDADNHASALDLAMRAGQISSTPSLRLFVAQEQQALGQMVDALSSAEQCIREAERNVGASHRAEIMQTCRDMVADLRGRVGRIVVRVPAGAAGLRVMVAGHELLPALYGVPYIVPPGGVLVVATAPGRPEFRQALQVGSGQTVDVDIAAGGTASSGAAAPAGATTTSGAGEGATASGGQGVVHEPSAGPGVAPIVLMVTGGAGLVVAGTLFALEGTTFGSLQGRCVRADRLECPDTPENRSTVDQALGFNTGAYVALGVGGAALAAGLTWWLLAPRAAHADRLRTMVTPTDGGLMLHLGGTL